MDVVNTNPTSLASLVSIVNSKVEPKLLTDDNFEILSIKPLTLTTSKHNTVAEIRVDLGANLPTKVLTANDRYSLRTVEFTRIDLKDIAKFRNLTVNAKGQYVADVTDLAGVIELLGANIAEDELTLIPLSDAFIVKAAPDSLGYVGSLSFAGTADEEGEETDPVIVPPVLEALAIQGPATITAESEVTFTATHTPAELEAPVIVWTALNGSIDASGLYLAPSEAGVDTITATSGTISVTHQLTVEAKAAE